MLKLSQLKDLGACQDAQDLFEELFGQEVELTLEICTEHGPKFDLNWAAENLLSPVAWAEYERAQGPALAEYRKVKGLACGATCPACGATCQMQKYHNQSAMLESALNCCAFHKQKVDQARIRSNHQRIKESAMKEKDYADQDRQELISSTPAQPATHASRAFTVGFARARHGKMFAADPGSDWKPSKVPLLTRWLAQQHLKRDADVFAA